MSELTGHRAVRLSADSSGIQMSHCPPSISDQSSLTQDYLIRPKRKGCSLFSSLPPFPYFFGDLHSCCFHYIFFFFLSRDYCRNCLCLHILSAIITELFFLFNISGGWPLGEHHCPKDLKFRLKWFLSSLGPETPEAI